MELPKELSSIESIFWAIVSMLGVIMLLVIYSYIDKLEKINCECAEHPNRKFIKNYIIFAIIFLLVAAFLPPSRVVGAFGPLYGIIYAAVALIFSFATVVFYIFAMQYARFLMIEKCKCSEDIRREVMYIWSILMVVLFGVVVLIPFLVTIGQGGVALAMTSGKQAVRDLSKTSMEAVYNPVKSLTKVPKSFQKSVKRVFRK
jgi:hypothetical protein